LDPDTERRFREITDRLKLIAWSCDDGLCVGRMVDVCLLTIISDSVRENRFTIVQKGKAQAALTFDLCVMELEQLAAR